MVGPGARLLSVNVAKSREVLYRGNLVPTGIWKLPVSGRRSVGTEGLEGDAIVDRRVHGGADKAVYAYSAEDYAWWSGELGEELEPGRFGENLTTEGVDLNAVLLGERWRTGSTLLEASEPRLPCFKLGIKMEDPRFVRRFAKALRLGVYLRVIEPGEIGAGDTIEVLERPAHDVTIERLGRIAFGERELIAGALEVPELSEGWRTWLEERVRSEA